MVENVYPIERLAVMNKVESAASRKTLPNTGTPKIPTPRPTISAA